MSHTVYAARPSNKIFVYDIDSSTVSATLSLKETIAQFQDIISNLVVEGTVIEFGSLFGLENSPIALSYSRDALFVIDLSTPTVLFSFNLQDKNTKFENGFLFLQYENIIFRFTP